MAKASNNVSAHFPDPQSTQRIYPELISFVPHFKAFAEFAACVPIGVLLGARWIPLYPSIIGHLKNPDLGISMKMQKVTARIVQLRCWAKSNITAAGRHIGSFGSNY